jgi:hypothetical protein
MTAPYAEWRATIPFTNAEVAQAILDEVAEAVCSQDEWKERQRKVAAYLLAGGDLTPAELHLMLPRLIKRCNVCGRKALYRVKMEGRCSQHRMVRAA